MLIAFCKANIQLRSLNIGNINNINANCLQTIAENLVNLENLGICNYYNIPEELQESTYMLLLSMPKIKEFTLYEKNKNTPLLLKKIASYNRLESLTIFFFQTPLTREISGIISSMTNLKKIKFSGFSPVTDTILEDISCLEKLEEFSVISGEITNLGVEKFIEKCKEIRYIKVYGCRKITDELIPTILKHLEGRRHKLVMQIKLTKTAEIILKGSLNPHLLELVNKW